MIVICDINEIWRERPFSALAEKRKTLGVAPTDWIAARQHKNARPDGGALEVLSVTLPPGWASRTAWLGQRLLWKSIQQHCRKVGQEVEAVVVTSPHYLPLLDLVPQGVKTIYYASDDYRSYTGWGDVAVAEQALIHRVDHSFFVSKALMDRALHEYGMAAERCSVSMNASEPRFFSAAGLSAGSPLDAELARPVAGVIGAINPRLDFELLQRCAELPELGTLLLVGPLPKNPCEGLKTLLEQPKCVALGRQPHASIHQWFQYLDVGLIPYAPSEFNRLCSPVRLFDHLASGVPTVATDACEQVRGFRDRIEVCQDTPSFLKALGQKLSEKKRELSSGETAELTWGQRADAMLKIMEGLDGA